MNVKSFVIVARNALLSELEYRFNYFMWMLSTLISVAMESAVLLLAMKDHEVLGGFHREDLWKFVLVGIVVRTSTGQWKVVSEAIDEVREGGFRKYLLQPVFYPAYFVAQAMGDKLTITVLLILALTVYKILAPVTLFFSPSAAGMFLVAFAGVNVLVWQIYLLMIFGAFWIDETQFLQIAFNIGMAIFSGSLVPYQWLPEAVRKVVDHTPFPLLGDWPIRSALGRLSASEFWHYGGLAVFWIAFFAVVLRIMEIRGIKRYEAFGG
jgi:ABC-2 type transport system permease protein